MNLERGSGVALWRQIERLVEQEIVSGIHEPGARLPTEHALAGRFSVNRHTVRRALAALEKRGLVNIEQGRGSFVQEHVIDYFVRRRTRFHEIVAAQGFDPRARVLRTMVLPADPQMARSLAIRRGRPVILIETLSEVDGRPLSVASHYFSAARVPDMAQAMADTDSISVALARCGVQDYSRKVTRVGARMPTAEEARLLRQPASRPVVVSESVNVDTDDRPLEYGVARFASDRVKLVFEP